MENDTYWFEEEYFEMDYVITKGKIVSSFFLVVLIITTFIGNALVCIAFCQFRRLRIITNYFVFSLAVSDLLVATISMPLFLAYELTGWATLPAWIDLFKLYQFIDVIDIICCVSSIANLTAISIDRYFGIVMPLRHKTLMTESIAVTSILAVWFYSIVVAVVKLIPNFRHYIIFNFMFGFALPLFLISAAYIVIFITIKEHSKRKLSNALSQEWMLARTILIVISLFVVCWTPFYVIQILYQYCLTCEFFHSRGFDHVHSVVKLLQYSNSCCNPFVYGYFNVNFKQAFKSILFKCIRKKEVRDINANAPEASLATAMSSIMRYRSHSGVTNALSDVDCYGNAKPIAYDINGRRISDVSSTRNAAKPPVILNLLQPTFNLVQNITSGSSPTIDSGLMDMGSLDGIDGFFNEDTILASFNCSPQEIDSLLADAKESNL